MSRYIARLEPTLLAKQFQPYESDFRDSVVSAAQLLGSVLFHRTHGFLDASKEDQRFRAVAGQLSDWSTRLMHPVAWQREYWVPPKWEVECGFVIISIEEVPDE